jgi:hypothetical protein
MAIPLIDSFSTKGTFPIEESMQVADLTARDAIPSFKRYEGMITYVLSEEKLYYLKGGITNPDWTEFQFGTGLADGDYGDITVSGGATIFTIDPTVVTYSKIQNVGANSFLANLTGAPASLTEVSTGRIPLFSSNITGTPSGATYLRGDGVWATFADTNIGNSDLTVLSGTVRNFNLATRDFYINGNSVADPRSFLYIGTGTGGGSSSQVYASANNSTYTRNSQVFLNAGSSNTNQRARIAAYNSSGVGDGSMELTLRPLDVTLQSNLVDRLIITDALTTLNTPFRLQQYGGTGLTGTATKWLAVDASGNVIQEDPPGGGGGPETDPFAWRRLGNNDITEGTHFLGTTTNVPLEFRVNNVRAGKVNSGGYTFFGYEAGLNNTSTNPTFIGYRAGRLNTTGVENTSIGNNAMASVTTSNENTIIGFRAMESGTGGINTVMGALAFADTNNASYCVAIGSRAMSFATGFFNIGIGYSSLRNATGSSNLAVGSYALGALITGDNNIGIGHYALNSSIGGLNNIAIGSEAISNFELGNTTGNNNIGIGAQSIKHNTTGSNNSSIGIFSLSNNRTGLLNTNVGYYSLFNNTTGQRNVSIGAESGRFINNTTNLVDTTDWTSTGWTAGVNNFTWTHNTGNTNVLSHSFIPTVNKLYTINITISNRTTGSISATIGGRNLGTLSVDFTYPINDYFTILNTNVLQITPTSDFDGTVSVEIIDNKLCFLNNSIFIGYNTKASQENSTNEIVIGYETISRGSNTTTIGNSSTTSSKLFGVLNIGTTPEYADNTAALGGGLVAGDVYRTGDNLKVVH